MLDTKLIDFVSKHNLMNTFHCKTRTVGLICKLTGIFISTTLLFDDLYSDVVLLLKNTYK